MAAPAGGAGGAPDAAPIEVGAGAVDVDPHDALIDGIEAWSEAEKEKYIEGLDDHPLFMDKSPTLEEAKNNEYLSQLMSMQYDDDDGPEDLAEKSKEKGNEAFRKGKAYYPNAKRHYNDALDHLFNCKVMSPELLNLEATVLANRSAIWLAEQKFTEVIRDCNKAVEINPKNTKAHFRLGKAFLAMGNAKQALIHCDAVRAIEGKGKPNKLLAKLRKEVEEALAVQEKRRLEAEAARKKREDAAQRMREACTERGLRVGKPVFPAMRRYDVTEPWMDERECMHWPVLLLYEEALHADYVADFMELTTFGDHLEVVLPNSGAPPPWDSKGVYRCSNVDVFYQEDSVEPRDMSRAFRDDSFDVDADADEEALADEEDAPPGADAAVARALKARRAAGGGTWVRVPLKAMLMLVLVQRGYVIPGYPVFHVVARGTSFYRSFVDRAGGEARIKTLAVPDLPGA